VEQLPREVPGVHLNGDGQFVSGGGWVSRQAQAHKGGSKAHTSHRVILERVMERSPRVATGSPRAAAAEPMIRLAGLSAYLCAGQPNTAPVSRVEGIRQPAEAVYREISAQSPHQLTKRGGCKSPSPRSHLTGID
jgi:hypothetical protein